MGSCHIPKIERTTNIINCCSQIKKIRLGHDGTGIGAGWFVDDVVIDVPSNGECYRFAMHRWLAEDEEDGKTEIELEPSDVSEKDKRKY